MDRSGPAPGWIAAATLAVMLAVVWPILAHPHLPLTDLPNHIARYHVIAQGGAGPLARYYETPFLLVPNAAADLIWRLVMGWADPVAFARWVMAGYAVNLIAAVMVLARLLHGRWMLWPLAAAVLVYNGNFLFGFQNYLVSAPFVIWGICLWLATERWPVLVRLAVLLPFASGLYLMHFFAFAALAIAALGRELQRLVEAPRGQRARALGQGLALGLAFVPALAHLVAITLAAGPGVQGSVTTLPSFATIRHAVMSIAQQGLLEPRAVLWSALAVVLGGWVVLLLALWRGTPRLALAPRMRGILIALTVALLAAPSDLNGVGFVNIRLPFLVLALLIASTRWVGLTLRGARLVAVVVLTLLALRVGVMDRLTRHHSAEIADLMQVLQDLPADSRVLPLRGPAKRFHDPRLWHAGAYAVVMRDSYIPTLFQGVHSLVVRPEWLDIAHPQSMAVALDMALEGVRPRGVYPTQRFWMNWAARYTHVLLLDDVPAARLAAHPLRAIARAGRFSLYAVTPPAVTPPAVTPPASAAPVDPGVVPPAPAAAPAAAPPSVSAAPPP